MGHEVMMKTHLIVTKVENDYHIKWLKRVIDTKPMFKNNKPIFVIVGGNGRMELNTTDMKYVEKCARKMTLPKGRTAFTSDTARIYIKEAEDKEELLGVLTHNKVKTFAPMFDPVWVD